jgi:hypothetical protein
MDDTASPPQEAAVRFFQTVDTLVLESSAGARYRERNALAVYAAQALVSEGWTSRDAWRMVSGLATDKLWAVLRKPVPQPSCASPERNGNSPSQ